MYNLLNLRSVQAANAMLGAKVEPDSYVRVIDFFIDSVDLVSLGFRHVSMKEEGRPPDN